MTTFHENIRNVLSEIDKFIDSLKSEKLSKKVQTNKEKVIELIKKLREEWPALENPAQSSELKVPVANNERDVSNESIQTKSSHGSGNAEDDDTAYGDNVPDKAVKDLTNPVKAGYLDKKRKKATLLQSAFQRRYCVIQDRIFYYFEKNKDTKQAGAFYLEGYEFREAPHLVKDASKKDLSFELVAPGKRSYQFTAESKEEFQAWRDAITGTGSSSENYYYDPVGKPAGYTSMQRPPGYTEHKYEGRPGAGDGYYLEPVSSPHYVNDAKDGDRSSVYVDVMTPPLPTSPPPELVKKASSPPAPALPPPRREPLVLTVNPDEDYENMYYGKWDHKAESENELGFKYGDIIHIINRDFQKSGWWVGRVKNTYGLVSSQYLVRAYKAAK